MAKPKPIVLDMTTAVCEPLYNCPCGARYLANPAEMELAKRSAHRTWGWRVLPDGSQLCGECVAKLPV